MTEPTTKSTVPDDISPAKKRLLELGKQVKQWVAEDRHEEILAAHDELIALTEEVGDEHLTTFVLYTYSFYYWRVGRFDDAFRYLQKSLAIVRRSGSPRQIGALLNNIGNIFRVRGYPTEARENYDQALTEFRAIDDKEGIANSLGNIAVMYIESRRHAEAEPYLLEAIQIFHDLGDQKSEANFLGDYAKVQFVLNQPEQSIATAERAVALAEAIPDNHTLGTVLNSLGLSLIAAKRFDEAFSALQRALEANRIAHNQRFEGVTLSNLGFAASEMGNFDRAIEYFNDAVEIHRRISDVKGTTLARWSIINVYFNQHNWEKCNQLIADIADDIRDLNNSDLEIIAFLKKAEVHRRLGDFVEAFATAELVEGFSQAHFPELKGLTQSYFALIELDQNRIEQAATWLLQAKSLTDQNSTEAITMYWLVQTRFLIDSSSMNRIDEQLSNIKQAYRQSIISDDITTGVLESVLKVIREDVIERINPLKIELS